MNECPLGRSVVRFNLNQFLSFSTIAIVMDQGETLKLNWFFLSSCFKVRPLMLWLKVRSWYGKWMPKPNFKLIWTYTTNFMMIIFMVSSRTKPRRAESDTLHFLAYLVTQTVHLKGFILAGSCPAFNFVYLTINLNLLEVFLLFRKQFYSRLLLYSFQRKLAGRLLILKGTSNYFFQMLYESMRAYK